MDQLIQQISENAKAATSALNSLSTESKDELIIKAAKKINQSRKEILTANQLDVEDAITNEKDDAFIDRLLLTDERIDGIIETLNDIAKLPDPVGKVLETWKQPNGLEISRVRTPLGTIGIIFESRPNVSADASALCIKSGNAVVLRSGSDSLRSSQALVECFTSALNDMNLPIGIVQIIPSKDRAMVTHMLKGLNNAIDVIVPRGGKSLVQAVQDSATIPVFGHLEGICHTYIDKNADINTSISVVTNAKMRRPGICGALETLLIHKNSSEQLNNILDSLIEAGCEIRGCEKTVNLDDRASLANDIDWDTEYLSPILSVKIVDNIDEAIEHIQKHGTGHTDVIISEDKNSQDYFINQLDSAILMINASSQFADGGEFGMGGEIGIATGKFHARGPVSLEQLTSFKYVVRGSGQTRT
jgi:glutamate-5-semialdehyde dehydrogenase|tara:strand:- start:201 stop:1451 length:1251 start_codon:yes stop_codon:yes gene_type:complete